MIRRLRFWFRTTFAARGESPISDATAARCQCIVATMMGTEARDGIDSLARLSTEMTAMEKRGGPVPDELVDAAGDCAG